MKVEVPIGFRFRPTDEELLLHYLRRKVFSLPLPAPVVRPTTLDLFHIHPHHLPGDLREKRYFFIEKNVMNNGGHWKVNVKLGGKVINIMGNGSNQAVGLKRSLVYYQGKKKTNWFMHEFRLLASTSTQECPTLVQVGNWILCCIYQKKKKIKAKKTTQHSVTNNVNVIKGSTVSSVSDLTMMEVIDDGTNELGSTPTQDCSSSGITELTGEELNDEEVCSKSALLS